MLLVLDLVSLALAEAQTLKQVSFGVAILLVHPRLLPNIRKSPKLIKT